MVARRHSVQYIFSFCNDAFYASVSILKRCYFKACSQNCLLSSINQLLSDFVWMLSIQDLLNFPCTFKLYVPFEIFTRPHWKLQKLQLLCKIGVYFPWISWKLFNTWTNESSLFGPHQTFTCPSQHTHTFTSINSSKVKRSTFNF